MHALEHLSNIYFVKSRAANVTVIVCDYTVNSHPRLTKVLTQNLIYTSPTLLFFFSLQSLALFVIIRCYSASALNRAIAPWKYSECLVQSGG